MPRTSSGPAGTTFDGRVAIVTGAGRGIGRATAMTLAAHGAKVVVNDLGASLDGAAIDSGPARLVASEIEAAGGVAVANEDSVAEWTSAQRIIECAADTFGRVDILVNNAGLSASAAIWDHDPELFDRVVRSHLHGTFYCLRAALPHMKAKGYGRIVNLVSRAGLLGVPEQAAYGAGKGGVFALTNVVSREVADSGIRVNAVNPAATETRMVTTAIDAFKKVGGESARMAAGLEAALQAPDNVAALVAALCREQADRWNGEIFYLEKDRVALFDPISTGQEAPGKGAWDIEGIVRAIDTFAAHEEGTIYTGGEEEG